MSSLPLCRFCQTPLVHTVVDLGLQPLSNAYLSEEKFAAGTERTYPLHARVCDRCFLVQADDAVPADEIFDADYAYFSSYSTSWLEHCRAYAEAAMRRFKLGPQSLVVEVASNDGYLLQYFLRAGTAVLGIEPTANTAEVARAKGIETEVVFFNEATGRALAARGVRADLMHGANVFAHVPDIGDFAAGFQHVLKPEGTVTFEFPHLLRMMEKVQFDTIYHEHFSYLSLVAVDRVLAANGLKAYDVEELWTHGGSLRLYCCRSDAPFAETAALKAVRAAEQAAGLDRIETYAGFAARVEAVREGFLTYLAEARRTGRKVAAYGAAAKGNTFLNYCGVGPEDIVAVFDRNPHKQGKRLPGSHIPILPPGMVSSIRPDDVLILPWNLKAEIVEQLAYIREWGGRFVTAAPDVEIIA
ncbi:MAG TPA: class I SAM-dependent methyltransferase [Caulobacteraceae bacterium]|jgi:SAM-dependent methyltransferase|nr:class I SAM-dependent methyltransferase [Caulobacteraceae bacterium]